MLLLLHRTATKDAIMDVNMDAIMDVNMDDMPQEIIDMIMARTRVYQPPPASGGGGRLGGGRLEDASSSLCTSPFSQLARTSTKYASNVTKATKWLSPNYDVPHPPLVIPSVYRSSVREVVLMSSATYVHRDLRPLDVSPLADQVPLLVSLSLVPGDYTCFSLVGLAALSSLTRLERLKCVGCRLDDAIVDDIGRLTRLRTLDLSRNGGGDGIWDLSPLSKLTNLNVLNCGYTHATSLRWLEALATSLRILDISGNQNVAGFGISHLAAFTRLDTLDCRFMTLRSLAGISGLVALTNLDVSDNHLEGPDAFSPLAGLTRLSSLKCRNEQRASIGPLSSLTGLTHLECSVTLRRGGVTPLAPLSNLKSLRLRRIYGEEEEEEEEEGEDEERRSDFVGVMLGLTKLRQLTCPKEFFRVGHHTYVTHITALSNLQSLRRRVRVTLVQG